MASEMGGKSKKKNGVQAANGKPKNVEFKGLNDIKESHANGIEKLPAKGMRPSPSQNTLNRLERDQIVIWNPWRFPQTVAYAVAEVFVSLWEFLCSLRNHKISLFLLSSFSAGFYYAYITQGPHSDFLATAEKSILWWSWWVFLGVLSSIGFGSGLHTFLIYLGPHIAKVTMAAYDCNTLDFPEPPYPVDIVCPDGKPSSSLPVTLWAIVSKVRVEALLWGAGTALGELPPYFMARAARLSGQEPDDEEYKEFLELMNAEKQGNKDEISFMDRAKMFAEKFIAKVGFPGILLFASIPNPLFDLAGITCGHFLVPFWSFFGATLIGKAIVKMHVQMLFVIIAFSEHHVEDLVQLLAKLPAVGEYVEKPIRDLIAKQKAALHRTPGEHVDVEASWLAVALNYIVLGMIAIFAVSIINSLAQRFHKRLCDRKKKTV